MGWILATFLLIVAPSHCQAASTTVTDDAGTPISSSIFLTAQLSSSVFFQNFALEYYRRAEKCKQLEYIPSRNRILKVTNAIWIACQVPPEIGTWIPSKDTPGPEWRPYYMFTLMMSESGGKSRNTSKPSEKTYGFCCGSITEARGVCYVKQMPCPKYNADVIEKLQNDLPWAALISLKAWEYYSLGCKGNIMAGLMCYKYGPSKFADLMLDYNGNMKSCEQYGSFMRRLDSVKCILTQMGFADTCFCFAKE